MCHQLVALEWHLKLSSVTAPSPPLLLVVVVVPWPLSVLLGDWVGAAGYAVQECGAGLSEGTQNTFSLSSPPHRCSVRLGSGHPDAPRPLQLGGPRLVALAMKR